VVRSAILEKITKKDLISYLCRFHCNNFETFDPELFPTANGTYPIGSLFNHSCFPNCVPMYHYGKMVIKCIHEVEAGAELCVTYLDVILEKEKRKEKLAEIYYFECGCRRCVGEEVGLVLEEKKWEHGGVKGKKCFHEIFFECGFSELAERVLGVTKQEFGRPSQIWEEILKKEMADKIPIWELKEEFKNHDKFCQGYVGLVEKVLVLVETKPIFDISIFRIFSEIKSMAISVGDWRVASLACKYICAMDLVYYPNFHPMVGLAFFELAQCIWNDGDSVQADDFIKIALKVFKVTHSSHSCNQALWDRVVQFKADVDKEVSTMI